MAGRCRGERGKWRQHGGRKKKRFAFCAGAGAGRRGWGQRDSRTRTPTRANPGAGPRALACFRPGAPPRAPTGTLVGVRERVPGRPPVLHRCVFPVGTRTSLSETEGTRGLPAGCGGHGGGAHRGGEQAAGCVCARRPGPSPPGAPGAPPAIPRTHPRARAAVRTIPAHAGPRGRRSSSSRRRPCGVTRAAVTEPPALPKPGRRRLPYRPSPAPPPPARAPADPRAAFCRRAARGARAVHVVCVSLCVCVCTRVYHPAGASLRESERVRGVLCSSLAVAHDVRVAGRPGHARGAG